MTKKAKLLLSLLVISAVGGIAGFATWSAFTATTANAGNTITAGSVSLSDSDGGTASLYTPGNAKPGDTTVKCIRVTFGGSLSSAVKLYVSSGITNGSLYNLQVERGSGIVAPASDMNCTGFTQSSIAYTGTLGAFPTTYAAGVDGKASAAAWALNDTVDYRFTITQNDDVTPNAHTSTMSSGTHTFTWEARNN